MFYEQIRNCLFVAIQIIKAKLIRIVGEILLLDFKIMRIKSVLRHMNHCRCEAQGKLHVLHILTIKVS
jgi:hypothetical protein